MKTLLLDMYGVIIKEARGNFKEFITRRKPQADYELYKRYYHTASLGKLDNGEFLRLFGFDDAHSAVCDYVENFLTFDDEFIPFAENCLSVGYQLVLLSNDIAQFSTHIREFYRIDKYFNACIVSSETGLRKPDKEIFMLALKLLDCSAKDCIFIDDNYQNLCSAEELGINSIMFNREFSGFFPHLAVDFKELLSHINERM